MTITKGEILPCPCCAWTGWKLTHDPTCFVGQTNEKEPASDGFQIRCDKCGLQTCWWHHREQAVTAWNTRPSAQVRNEALEEAAKILTEEANRLSALAKTGSQSTTEMVVAMAITDAKLATSYRDCAAFLLSQRRS